MLVVFFDEVHIKNHFILELIHIEPAGCQSNSLIVLQQDVADLEEHWHFVGTCVYDVSS